MCNLYSLTRTREELVNLFAITRDTIGAGFDFAAVYPDTLAPVVRIDEQGGRELEVMRWGFPPPGAATGRPQQPPQPPVREDR